MDIIIHLGLAAAGIALLCVGADRLVAGAAALAARFGVSGFVIGVTVVAYGTSTPELAASIQAAMQGAPGLILGNVAGSNIANIGMVLGAAAVLGAVCVGRDTMRREVPAVLGVSVLLMGVSADHTIGWADGMLLLAGLAAFTVYALRKPRSAVDAHAPRPPLHRNIGMAALGAGLLYAGAILTVDNSVLAAEWFGVPAHVIGVVVLAVGTSLPELVATIMAVRRGRSDIGVANIIGSNLLNILLVVGAASLVAELAVDAALWLHYVIMLCFAAALFLWWNGRQARWVGPALAGSYVAYVGAVALL